MTTIRNVHLPHTYRDSVVLMELSHEISVQAGVQEAAVMMGTPANLEVLRAVGLLTMPEDEIAPDDLLVAIKADNLTSADQAIEWATHRLKMPVRRLPTGKQSGNGPGGRYQGWRNISKESGLALISTPGQYAASEAWKALHAGLHVFLFSDHVSVEDEIALKQAGKERDFLVMGPECGTAIISGVPLGFANKVRHGPIGLVAASGTGLQEVTCLINRLGSGISHAIGTGSRDLSLEVGGITMRQGIDLLLSDEATQVLVLISKPPSPAVAEHILASVQSTSKPFVVCFIGTQTMPFETDTLHPVKTLEEAAQLAVRLVSGKSASEISAPAIPPTLADKTLLRGLFSGGTLAYEAMSVLHDQIGSVWSNKPLDPAYQLHQLDRVDGHICLDLGAEEYTTGQPHPMIDFAVRTRLLTEMAHDAGVGIILLDIVLGYGGHPDPAGALRPAIKEAQRNAAAEGRSFTIIASVTGTDDDPQPRTEQVNNLIEQGVIVAPSSTGAARAAAQLLASSA